MVASVANDVDTAEECNWRQYCVRAIKQCNLALVVWFFALCDENVQTSLFSREFCAKLFACHVLSLFDNPEVEDFCLYNEVILVRNLLLNLCNLLAWESWNDTVYQCSANIAIVCEPALESFVVSTEILFPKFDILIDALLEVVTVQEDKLARHDDKTLLRITIKELVAVEQQLNQLAWVAAGRSICKLALVVESDTSLCSVRDYEANLRLLCQSHVSQILCVRVDGTADNIDTLKAIYSLAIETTLKVYVIEAVLTIEPIYHTALNRLNYYYRTIEVGLLVHVPYNPVYKCT